MTLQIFIVAGEPSGDLLGANLVRGLRQSHPEYIFQGVGGIHMQKAGVDIVFDSHSLAIIGFLEVIKKFPIMRRAMRTIVATLKKDPPGLLILIDYPGFNLRLAAKAKALGIKVMYYVSPQIWAWHYSRIKIIKKNVDLMAVLFGFEEALYRRENIPVVLVGHPLVTTVRPTLSRDAAYGLFQLDRTRPVIAFMPGSRLSEIQRLLPDMIDAAKQIREQIPEIQCVLPLAANLTLSCLSDFDLRGIHVIEHHTYNVLSLCDAAVVASGTATLEVAMLQIPQVIVYRVNALTYQIAKRVAKVPYCGLCNIVAEESIAVELLQQNLTPSAIAAEALKLLNDTAYRRAIQERLAHLRTRLQQEYHPEKLIDAITQLVPE